MCKKMVYLFLTLIFGLALPANAANIVWVSENLDLDTDGVVDDWEWVEILESAGHSVFSNPGAWVELEPNEVEILNNADLVIFSRGSNSGGYANDANEIAQWNAITAPMILMNPYLTRSNRWMWINSTTMDERAKSPNLEALDLNHPVFYGVALDVNNQVQVFDPNVQEGDVTFIGTTDVGSGTLIAKAVDLDYAFIAEWEKGIETYEGSGQFLGARRLLFTAGIHPPTAGFGGEYNLTDEGLKVFLNAVDYMVGQRSGPANIVWVSENLDLDTDGVVDDWEWVEILESEGHIVFSNPGAWADLEPNEIDILNNADLVIFSRGSNSGGYANDADEIAQWNAITAPIILMNPYLTRSSRWLWINSTTMDERAKSPNLEALDLGHPIFVGVALDENNQMQVFDPNVQEGDVTFIATTDVGNGTLIAKAVDLDYAFIAEWEKGIETYEGSGQFFGNRRLLFTAGIHPPTAGFGGEYNLTDEGLKLFLNTVNYMLAVPPRVNAYLPNPANGQIDVPRAAVLSWKGGIYAVTHDVYFGTVLDDVKAASRTNPLDVLVSQEQQDTTYTPVGIFDFGRTYYWRIDEVGADSKIYKGDIWSFTAANFTVVDDFEGYNDGDNRIFTVWGDYFVNNTGMTVGHFDPPFAEQSMVHSGSQSMYMRYDNDGAVNEGTDYEQSGTLTFSEAEREWADPQDWTADGAESLTLWFRGLPAPVGSFAANASGYTMTGAGADIWGASDGFHYAYKQLSGAGSITAKVVSMTNTHPSAKAGVMIRQMLEPGSTHVMVNIQPMNEVQFIHRLQTDDTSAVDSQADVTTPVWVRASRAGNTFTGEYSTDGKNWLTLGSVTMPMLVEVYVGLIVCSHDNLAACAAEFSDVTITGTVTGEWQTQDIGVQTNSPEPMYVVLEDSAGNSGVVNNPDAGASAAKSWTEWNIPFVDFIGVNMQAIEKMSIGVGDRVNPQAGGSGDLYIDDIRLYLPPN